MILDEETIEWISVDDALPDDATTVLVYAPKADEPVWLGFYSGEWSSVEGIPYSSLEGYSASVTAWAAMPMGPERGLDR